MYFTLEMIFAMDELSNMQKKKNQFMLKLSTKYFIGYDQILCAYTVNCELESTKLQNLQIVID